MNLLSMNINKTKLWWCKQQSKTSYAEPVVMYENVQPTNLDGDIVAYGLDFSEYLRIKGSLTDMLLEIKEGDKFYYNKPIPATHDIAQTTPTSANFIVVGKPTVTKTYIDIRLKRVSGRQ